jgi:RNA polymerase sigma-70 factor, ECF subfamily
MISAQANRFQSLNLQPSISSGLTRHSGNSRRARQAEREREDALRQQIFSGCQERVYRLALRITRNQEDAEDSQQEALLKAYRHMDQFQGRSQFTTWISRIAINEALMNLRKRKDAFHVPLEDVVEQAEELTAVRRRLSSPPESPEAAYSRKELGATLNAAIDRLRPLYRSVFVMRTVEELSTTETASKLQISNSAVKTRLRRARNELRSILRDATAAANGPLSGRMATAESWVA